MAPIVLQGTLVTLQDGVDLNSEYVSFWDADQNWWVVVDHPASVDYPGQLGESLQIIMPARLPHGLAHLPSGLLPALGIGEQSADLLLARQRGGGPRSALRCQEQEEDQKEDEQGRASTRPLA